MRQSVARLDSSRSAVDPIDPRVEQALRYIVAIGAVLVLLLPAARASSAQIGWLPLWLLAMPLTAWWALHRFRLPWRAQDQAAAAPVRRRRPGAQARRRARPLARAAAARAA
ncbi:hypothetical protein [Lysobacter sp. Root983]|uniref:hypothetical protein n=1 Tax=Lysobacter sp. Root983 TaxID=1736613 RepID=UPI00070A474B|nr:hypothetical protein [Lysobacter sp. Root983]KRD77129.1 hypothetical protein ASE43_08145 [Lysobacter sp. Root983]